MCMSILCRFLIFTFFMILRIFQGLPHPFLLCPAPFCRPPMCCLSFMQPTRKAGQLQDSVSW